MRLFTTAAFCFNVAFRMLFHSGRWSRMTHLAFSAEDQQALHKERFEHPHPRVQQRMEVLWLISQGLVYPEAARFGGVSEATVDRYVAAYRQGGLAALRELKWGNSTSELLDHRDSLEES